MNQDFAASAFNEFEIPKKEKKRFCFAAIPFLFIAVISLIALISRSFDIPSNWLDFMREFDFTLMTSRGLLEMWNAGQNVNDLIINYSTIGNFFHIAYSSMIFIGALLATILLFAKCNKPIIGLPFVMFSIGTIFRIASYLILTFVNNFSAYIKAMLPDKANIPDSLFVTWFYQDYSIQLVLAAIYFVCLLLLAVAFIIIALHLIIVTARKKRAPKVLWIIPLLLYLVFAIPEILCITVVVIAGIIALISASSVEYFDLLLAGVINFVVESLNAPFFAVAVISLLPWVSFAYKKKKKSKEKNAEIPVEETVAQPVTVPSVEKTPDIIPEIKPEVQAAPVSRPVPPPQMNRPPVQAPPVNRPVPPQPVRPAPVPPRPVNPAPVQPQVNNRIENQRENMQLLKDYKELLDSGVITQEDYDKKKSELLGL